MQVNILREEGADLALRGMAYSFKRREEPVNDWWMAKAPRAWERAGKLALMEGGHNKFLRQITLWVDIEAPRAWWSEFDTYKVGTVAQSESTMHTLSKRPPERSDFEVGTHPAVIEAFVRVWEIAKGDISVLKMNLPEGFLQRRLVTMNYQVLREVIRQRRGHRLRLWAQFIEAVEAQVEHPEWLA